MAEEEQEPEVEEEEEEEVEAGPRMIMGMRLPTFLFLVLNLLVMLGSLGGVFYIRFIHKPPVISEHMASSQIKKEAAKNTTTPVVGEEGSDANKRILLTPQKSINLRTTRGGKNHFLSIQIAYECSNSACMEQLRTFSSEIEDRVREIISLRSFRELSANETKFHLKHKITQMVNSLIKDGTVTDTYFNNFILQ